MNIIIEKLEANMEAYTEIQAQEALDTARAAMRVLYAEEVYTIERLGQGLIQLRALENKVVEVKNRLRIADLQMVFLKQKLVNHGFVLGDDVQHEFIERLPEDPIPNSLLTTSKLARISTLPPALASSPATATDLLLQEPVARPDVSSWTLSTPPGPPEVGITENIDHDNSSEGDMGSDALHEPDVDVTEDNGHTLGKAVGPNMPGEGHSLV